MILSSWFETLWVNGIENLIKFFDLWLQRWIYLLCFFFSYIQLNKNKLRIFIEIEEKEILLCLVLKIGNLKGGEMFFLKLLNVFGRLLKFEFNNLIKFRRNLSLIGKILILLSKSTCLLDNYIFYF